MSNQISGISNGNKKKPPLALDLFYNPERPTLNSAMSLERLKRMNIPLSRHKPFNYNFTRNTLITPALNGHLYADTILAYKEYGDINSGYKFILVVQDGLSKMAYTEKLMTLNSFGVAAALDKIIMRLDLPGHVFFLTDQGKEFLGAVPAVLTKYGITRVFLTNRHKASIVERFK